MNRQTAVAQARAHIAAWSHHDWDKTRQLLAPDVHVLVTSTQHENSALENLQVSTPIWSPRYGPRSSSSPEASMSSLQSAMNITH